MCGKIWESGKKITAAASIRTARPRQAKETRRTSDQQDDYPHAAAADKDVYVSVIKLRENGGEEQLIDYWINRLFERPA